MKRIMQQTLPTTPKLHSRVPAGIPSDLPPELEFVDLNKLLADEYSVLLQVSGSSMETAIYESDYVVVKLDQQPKHGDVVIASVNGEYTAKIYRPEKNGLSLVPLNENFKMIEVRKDFHVIGVVIWILKRASVLAAFAVLL